MSVDTSAIISQYFTEHIRKGFRSIYDEQRAIADRKIYDNDNDYTRSRSHALQKALQNPDLSLQPSPAGITAVVKYPSYIRFLDMKRIKNYRIYNRPIWGQLYKETFQNIRYEFSDWLRKNFGEEIRKCFFQS